MIYFLDGLVLQTAEDPAWYTHTCPCLQCTSHHNKSSVVWHHPAFLQRAAKLTLQALYMLQQIRPSVCPSVSLSVRHTPVLCQNEGTQEDAVFIIG